MDGDLLASIDDGEKAAVAGDVIWLLVARVRIPGVVVVVPDALVCDGVVLDDEIVSINVATAAMVLS